MNTHMASAIECSISFSIMKQSIKQKQKNIKTQFQKLGCNFTTDRQALHIEIQRK